MLLPHPLRLIAQNAALAAPLAAWQRRALWGFLLVLIAFGGIVEMRSAFLHRRMTDLGVYLRAAWAVRSGADIYAITDENGWHYQYPPFFAILLTPLADPPPGVDRSGALPFALSVGLWYLFNVGCLAFAVHKLASVVEDDDAPRLRLGGMPPSLKRDRSQRWWILRVVPILICVMPIGQTLMRGQVSLLLLALVSGMLSAWQQRRDFRAGCWLAAAICLKVIPAFLLIVPLWQRNLRWLAGCAVGLVLGLGVLPIAVFGWTRTVDYYVAFDRVVLRPGIGHDEDRSRAKELMNITSTDNQSLQALMHNTLHMDRWTRPTTVSPAVRFMHLLIGGVLTGITLWTLGRQAEPSGLVRILFVGALIVNMLLLSPVTHLHYLCLCLPLTMGVLVAVLERGERMLLGMRWTFPLTVFTVCGLLAALPGFEGTRDLGLAMYGAITLWAFACAVLFEQRVFSGEPLKLQAAGSELLRRPGCGEPGLRSSLP